MGSEILGPRSIACECHTLRPAAALVKLRGLLAEVSRQRDGEQRTDHAATHQPSTISHRAAFDQFWDFGSHAPPLSLGSCEAAFNVSAHGSTILLYIKPMWRFVC